MDTTGVREGKWHRETHRPQDIAYELHLRKIAARWVSHALKEVQRWLRYAICSNHFARWQQDGKKPERTAGDGSLVDKAIPGYADQQPSGTETDLVDSVGLMGRIGQRQTEC
ncbi:hypothetical protein TNIN_162591 [Trichonephila inaurata madagascariensis]|uniref:Uncharacterized protein n=1 Tax=Trichonephila inaurata madagascariensis TaxID=2747483 RepID=A0A8X6YVS7_9ARAC|nr:hypothetical protein TNIN_162591 [Trichonephila inaurata madagascariensis]